MHDHYPWHDLLLTILLPGSTPAQPAPAPALPARIQHGGYLICSACRLVDTYCACNRQPVEEPQPAEARASASLEQRIKEARR
jgi:hypothetical protein